MKSGSSGRPSGPPKMPGIMLIWKCVDKNNDPVIFSISRKYEGSSKWIEVQKDIMDIKLMLNTQFMPDGKYRIKLTASDEKANMEGKGFRIEKELEESITVDRTAPVLSDLKTRKEDKKTVIACSVSDALSIIGEGYYRVNEKDWEQVSPSDMLYDEKKEEFEISIPQETIQAGDVIILRFVDKQGNYVLKRITVEK
jgi:hypothetical protein